MPAKGSMPVDYAEALGEAYISFTRLLTVPPPEAASHTAADRMPVPLPGSSTRMCVRR